MARNPARWLKLLSLACALVVLVAACGGDDDEPSDGSGGSDSAEGGGEANVSGSSTVEPISALVAEEFFNESGNVVNVDGPGTGDGFELFCSGETDIADASRPISDEEIAACEANGIEYVELLVAYDGLSVVTSPANDAVTCLNFEDLYAMISAEAEGVANWNDAEALAGELGSTTDLPDAPLDLTGPGSESGTYDSFAEIVMADISEARFEAGLIEEGQVEAIRTDYDASRDDNVIVSNVEASESSLGWVGLAFATEAGDQLKILEVDGGDGCVTPTDATVADGSYPVARGLYIYVNTAAAEDNPTVSGYVDFYLADLALFGGEAGYVALTDAQVAETVAAWEAR